MAGLAACSPVVSLIYTPPHAVVPGPPASLAAATATDARGMEPYVLQDRSTRNGNVPIAYTHRPVADEVATVFTKALQVRGMVAATAPYRIRLTVHRLNNQTFFSAHIYDNPATDDSDANVGIEPAVTDQSGRVIYQDAVQDSRGLVAPSDDRDDRRLPALMNAPAERNRRPHAGQPSLPRGRPTPLNPPRAAPAAT